MFVYLQRSRLLRFLVLHCQAIYLFGRFFIYNFVFNQNNNNSVVKVVYDSAKLVKMKAIHNGFAFGFYVAAVVYDLAKIAKMKANHNHLEKNTNMHTPNIL